MWTKEKQARCLKKWKLKNPDYMKEWYQRHPDANFRYNSKRKKYFLARHLKRTYNITLEQYNAKFTEQDGKCAICFKHQKDLSRRLDVDHNHKTGKFRGLLCQKCNSNLLPVLENYNFLIDNAKRYLRLYETI